MNDTNLPGLLQLSEEFGFQMLPGVPEAQRVKYVAATRHRHKKSPPDAVSPSVTAAVSPSVAAAGTPSVAAAGTPSVAAAGTPSVAAAVSPSVAAAVTPSVAAAVPPIARAKSPPAAVPSVPPQPARLDSLIVSEYPPLFEEFRMKRWTVLWRGSRDGFTAKEFHRRCDGHANTLTLILDTKGNAFGGFTPVEWESRVWKGDGRNCLKGHDSLRSFLFTLRNPHGVRRGNSR
jgi:hypothetical protein